MMLFELFWLEVLCLIKGEVQVDCFSLVGEVEVCFEDIKVGKIVQVVEVDVDGIYSFLFFVIEKGVVFVELFGYFFVVQLIEVFGEDLFVNVMVLNSFVVVMLEEEVDIWAFYLYLDKLDNELLEFKWMWQEVLVEVWVQ